MSNCKKFRFKKIKRVKKYSNIKILKDYFLSILDISVPKILPNAALKIKMTQSNVIDL